mgnify:CR=1 FL=1
MRHSGSDPVLFEDMTVSGTPTPERPRPRVRSTTPSLIVSDLDRSIAFFRGLGFVDPAVHGDPPCFAMLNRDGFDVMLTVTVTESGAGARPNGPDGVWDMYIAVDDLDAEIAALQAEGIALDRGPSDTFYQMREIEVLDPDGHRICLAQDIRDLTQGQGVVEVWSGVLDVGSAKLRLVLRLTQTPEGLTQGALDSPDQNAMNLPIDILVREGATLRFTMTAIGAAYEGTFNEGVTELAGEWSQRGRVWPLVFRTS